MKNMIQKGKRMPWTNGTGADVASGDPVVVGDKIYAACGDIANGADGELAAEGVFEFPKTAGNAINQGTRPIYDVSAGAFVHSGAAPAAGDVSGAVTCWETAEAAAVLVRVKLGTGIGTVA